MISLLLFLTLGLESKSLPFSLMKQGGIWKVMGENSGSSPLLSDYTFLWGQEHLESRLKITRAVGNGLNSFCFIRLCACEYGVIRKAACSASTGVFIV